MTRIMQPFEVPRKTRKLPPVTTVGFEDAEMAGRPIVSGAHAFVLFAARAVGLAPMGFARLQKTRKRAQWLLTLSPTACVVSCVVLTGAVAFCLFGLISELGSEPKLSVRMRSVTARVVGSCDVLAVAATSVVGVYGAPARTRRTLRVLRLLSSVDSSLGMEIIYTKERNSCLIITSVVLLWTCLLIDDFSMYANQAKLINTHYRLFQNYIAFYLLYYVVVMLEVQFAFTAHAIYLRLKRLNDVLAATGRDLSLFQDDSSNKKKTSPVFSIHLKQGDAGPGKLGALVDVLGLVTVPDEAQHLWWVVQQDCPILRQFLIIIMKMRDRWVRVFSYLVVKFLRYFTNKLSNEEPKVLSRDPAETIQRLSDLHGTLCAAAREVDTSFGLPVLIILISTLLHLIVTPYFLILEMGGAHRPHQLVLQALWCMAHAFRLLVLVEPCHRTKSEAAKTGDIVGEMLGHGAAGSAVLRRLELFSRQLLHRSPDFTALGVCSLDRPLIASVTAAVTTYLVILIQFQKQDDLDKEKS